MASGHITGGLHQIVATVTIVLTIWDNTVMVVRYVDRLVIMAQAVITVVHMIAVVILLLVLHHIVLAVRIVRVAQEQAHVEVALLADLAVAQAAEVVVVAAEETNNNRKMEKHMYQETVKDNFKITPEEGALLWKKIQSIDLGFGARYLQYKHGWDIMFGERALEEYRRFIFLTHISRTEITPSECIDEVWHIHILHTKPYAEFSKTCGRFIHHNPGMPDEKVRWDGQYRQTLEMYKRVFGDVPPRQFWPRPVVAHH